MSVLLVGADLIKELRRGSKSEKHLRFKILKKLLKPYFLSNFFDFFCTESEKG